MNRLIVNALKSVGLVTSGDDPEAQVTFWKSGDEFEMLTESDVDTKVSTSAGSATVEEGDGMPMDLSAIDDADLRKSIEDAIEGLEAQNAELTEKLTELDPPDPIEKADDEVRELIEKERAEREALQKKLDEEVAKRRVSEFVAKAQPLEALIGKADEMGPVLEELERKAPDAFAKLDGALTAASQRSELSALFAKYGTEGDAEGDPIGRRDAFVKSYLAENPGKSEVEARAEFWTQNPDAKQDLRS